MTRPLGDFGRDLRQALSDVFIGKAVKSVASDPFVVQLVRDRVVIRDLIMIAMKGRIEAGDLRQRREIRQPGC